MSKFRKLGLSTALALSAIMATSGLTLAGTGNVLVQNVWGSAGAFGAWANFGAQYVATQTWTGTTQTWKITNLEMTALIKGGKNCGTIYCSGWGFAGVASFYDWHNTKVLTVNLPAGSCYSHAIGSTDLLFVECRSGTFTFSVNKPSVVTLTKMTLSWSVGVLVNGMFWFGDAWHTSKSLTLNPT